jgi:hypothetical protein
MNDPEKPFDLYTERGRDSATSDSDGPFTTDTRSFETLDNDLLNWPMLGL